MQVTVPSFAKLNLDLRVLGKRPDGYHELRTIFQTVSLKDTLTIEFESAKRTQIDVSSSVNIPGENLVVRSAKFALDSLKVNARLRFVLHKRIPMGAGLGGGSSNAAAVVLALPALARKRLEPAEAFRLAESLGSDVPFFLLGGTAVGLGRGNELYPLVDLPAYPVLLLSTGIHVSTAEAYRALGRDVTNALTSPADSPILREFQTIASTLAGPRLDQLPLRNDFEEAVFQMHPQLPALARKLRRLGARPVRMTGSGSALFGVFETPEQSEAAAAKFPAGERTGRVVPVVRHQAVTASPARFVSRRQYRAQWRRALGPAADRLWWA